MNIDDLKNFNVNSVDVQQWQSTLTRRQDILANVMAVIVSGFIIFNIVSAKENARQTLLLSIPETEKKNQKITQYQTASQAFDEFYKGLPVGLSDSSMIDKITDLADKHQVHISSFSPAKVEETKMYNRNQIKIDVTAQTYHGLWMFIYAIENAGLNLRIDRLVSSLIAISESDFVAMPTGQDLFKVQMEISSLNFKK